MIYIDSAATTKIHPEVLEAMMPYLTDEYFNPSSAYTPASKVAVAIDHAREIIATSIGAKPEQIYFTSGASESNSWALLGRWLKVVTESRVCQPKIITSKIEHKSIKNCVSVLGASFVPVDEYGMIDADYLQNLLKGTDKNYLMLTSIQWANNEIGTVQNIKALANMAHQYGSLFHTDATQAYGHIPVNVRGIDMLSASGHKVGAAKGVGFLYLKDRRMIDPIIFGAQNRGMRGGTENVAGIVGFGKAVEISMRNMEETARRMKELKNRLVTGINAIVPVKVNGINQLPNNLNITLKQPIKAETLTAVLNAMDTYISIGSACNAKDAGSSQVLEAIRLSDEDAHHTVRISLPDDFTEDECDKAIEKFRKAFEALGYGNDTGRN